MNLWAAWLAFAILLLGLALLPAPPVADVFIGVELPAAKKADRLLPPPIFTDLVRRDFEI